MGLAVRAIVKQNSVLAWKFLLLQGTQQHGQHRVGVPHHLPAGDQRHPEQVPAGEADLPLRTLHHDQYHLTESSVPPAERPRVDQLVRPTGAIQSVVDGSYLRGEHKMIASTQNGHRKLTCSSS